MNYKNDYEVCMLYFLMHFLSGYCHVAVTGPSRERFLKLLTMKQVLIWHPVREADRDCFYLSRKASSFLDEIGEKTGCSYEYLSKDGLPYLFYSYRKRKCFALAFFLCLLSMYILSHYIWRIEITGSYSHSTEELMDYLSSQGIRCGMKIKDLSCPDLEERVREDFADISWVSCNRTGTVLTLAVRETLYSDPGDDGNNQTPCNLIASSDGTISSIFVRSGLAKVKKGDKIKAGDVLISGLVPLINDAGEVIEEAKVPADGDIYVISKKPFSDRLPLNHTEKKYTGKYHIKPGIRILNHYYDLPDGSPVFMQADEETEEHIIHIGRQFYLPVSIIIHKKKEYVLKEKRYSKKEAQEAMEKRISYFLADYEAKGVEILKNNVKIDCDDSTCSANGIILMKERVGKIQRI